MKTYVRLKFNAKGAKPSEVYRLLKEHRFVPAIGEYDFVYDWGEKDEADMGKILEKLDALHNALGGKDVIYEVTTSDPMYHISEVAEPIHEIGPKTTSIRPPMPSQQEQAKEPACPSCGGKPAYIEKYKRWYCHTCKKYV